VGLNLSDVAVFGENLKFIGCPIDMDYRFGYFPPSWRLSLALLKRFATTMKYRLPQINIRQSAHSKEVHLSIPFNLGSESESWSERRTEEDERGTALPVIPLPFEVAQSHW
jgi:hypothetical protein